MPPAISSDLEVRVATAAGVALGLQSLTCFVRRWHTVCTHNQQDWSPCWNPAFQFDFELDFLYPFYSASINYIDVT